MKYVQTGELITKILLGAGLTKRWVNAPVYKIDHRAMERNKYAPWGRQAY